MTKVKANEAKSTRSKLDVWYDGVNKLKEAGKDYPIWPCDKKLEVIGLTGDEGAGKSLLALSIDPERTLCYSFEKGTGDYQNDLGFDEVDVRLELQKLHPKGYSSLQMYNWFQARLKSVPAGKYSVIVVDTIGDAEAGLADYVASKHKEYGYKTADSFRSMGGVFWSYVLAEWKYVLADVASKCQTFVYTSHLRSVWKKLSDGRTIATPEREPQGKRPLRQLSSLCLWLTREPNSEKPPSAETHHNKMRLCLSEKVGNEIVHYPCLPPAMAECTPNVIREYILDPVGKRRLRKAEKLVEHDYSLSDDDKLQLQAEISENQAKAKELALELERIKAAKEPVEQKPPAGLPKTEAAMAKAVQESKQSKAQDSSGMVVTSEKVGKPIEIPFTVELDAVLKPEPNGESNGFLSDDQLRQIAEAKRALRVDAAAWKQVLAAYDVTSARALTPDKAELLLKALRKQGVNETEHVAEETDEGKQLREWLDKALSPTK